MISKQEIHEILLAAWRNWPTCPVDGPTVALWYGIFKDEDKGIFQQALRVWITADERKYPPDCGSICKVIRSLRKTDDDLMTADEAWRRAMEISCIRPKVIPADCPDRLRMCISVVGLDRIAYSDSVKELPFVRRDFLAAWDRFKARDEELAASVTQRFLPPTQGQAQATLLRLESDGMPRLLEPAVVAGTCPNSRDREGGR